MRFDRQITRRTLTRALAALPFAGLATRTAQAQDATPSGKIAYVRGGDIWQWSGGNDSLYLEDGYATTPTWSPDGQELIFTRSMGSYANLVRFRSQTGTRRALTDNESYLEQGSYDYVAGSSWALGPYWSDAGIVCFVSDMQTSGQMLLWIMTAISEDMYTAPSDGTDLGNIEHVSVDDSGTYAVYTVLEPDESAGGTTYVALRNLNTGITTPVADGTTGMYDPDISPDGDTLVVSLRSPEGVTDLWLYNLLTGAFTQLTFGANAVQARWSPDGTWIAYFVPTQDQFELWAMPITANQDAAAGDAVRLVAHDDIDAPSGLSWAP